MAPLQQSRLRIAVLVVPPIQLLDMSPVDLFFMLSKSYLRDCQLPQAIIDRGLDEVEILYVADEQSCTTLETTTTTTTTTNTSSAEPTRLAGVTACLNIQITHTLTSPAVAPGQVDIVLVPGPDPGVSVSEPVKQFLQRHAKVPSSTTHILSICTGIFVLAQSGVLDGKTCTGPRPLLGMRLRKEFPRVNWVEKRWAVDDTETLWTAAGITNGQDMVAAYLRHRFSPELADLVCGFADVGYRKQEYENTNASEGAWFVWIMARSFFKRLVGVSVKGGGGGGGGGRTTTTTTADSTQQSKPVQNGVF